MKFKKNNQSGFTLIEIVIYIALFSIIISGCFVTAFNLIEGYDKLNTKAVLEEEGNFILRKIDWALTGTDPSLPPSITGSGCSQTLTTNKISFPSNPIVVRRQSSLNSPIEMKEGINSFSPISTANVSVSCLKFLSIPASGNSPAGITATVTINNHDYVITKYIRK